MKMNSGLKQEDFYKVVEKSPLVSVDLIIKNKKDEILLGYRNNNPAINTYFTPGAVIRKNESVNDAIKRVLLDEVNVVIEDVENRVKLNGVFNHFYDNNFKDDSFGTHYVCISYIVYVEDDNIKDLIPVKGNKYFDQHDELLWYPITEINNNPDIHPYVKKMVNYNKGDNFKEFSSGVKRVAFISESGGFFEGEVWN